MQGRRVAADAIRRDEGTLITDMPKTPNFTRRLGTVKIPLHFCVFKSFRSLVLEPTIMQDISLGGARSFS